MLTEHRAGYLPRLREQPNGIAALCLRRGIPVALVCVAVLLTYWQYRYERVHSSVMFIREYLALVIICAAASANWHLSPLNTTPWFLAPWRPGRSKAPWLVLSLVTVAATLRIMWVGALVAAVVAFLVTRYQGAISAKWVRAKRAPLEWLVELVTGTPSAPPKR